MRTNEILKELMDNEGFHNWNHWTQKECKEYVLANFECSLYVANNVARKIVNW